MNRKSTGYGIILLLILAIGCMVFGVYRGEFTEVSRGMTYGNFDHPNRASFVWERLVAGTPSDLAQRVVYRFDEAMAVHYRPLIALFVVFLIFFLLLYSGEGLINDWKRRLSQWLTFVALRLGVFRVSHVCPVSRNSGGVVPVLNCQACEMATGACPVGTLQVFLLKQRLPLFLLGSMCFFGIVLGRWICGWLCPFGMLSDLVERISVKSLSVPHWMRAGKFVVLTAVIVAAIIMGIAGSTTAPFCFTMCPAGKVLGLLPYYVTTGASEAAVTVVSPLQNTTGFLCMWWHIVGFLLFLAIMILAFGRVFCSVLCPLGGFLGLFNSFALVRISHSSSKCNGCDRCIDVCPMNIDLGSKDFLTVSDCITCGKCIDVCGTKARHWDGPLGCAGSCGESKEAPTLSDKTTGKVSLSRAEGCYIPLKGRVLRALLPLLSYSPQAMASYAKKNTRFYKKLYEGCTTWDFLSLPVLHKKQARACSPFDLLSEPFRNKVRIYGETTGSSGSPTPSFLTEKEFAGAALLSGITPYAGKLENLFGRRNVCVNGLAFGFTIAGMSFGDMLSKQGGLVANIGSRSTLATPERMADALSRLKPSIVTGTPIDFLCWMRILKEDFPEQYEEVLREMEVLLSSAELCADSRSRSIERYFGINHVDNYACVEGFFSMACPCGRKHILPMYHTELFDRDLSYMGQYGRGRLAFTNLMKQSTPMIRYLLDDLVTITPSSCPWGFKKDIVPHGRYELSIEHGGKLLNVGDFEEVIFENTLFADYRITILDDEKAELVLEEYEEKEGSGEDVARRLKEAFNLEITKLEVVPFGSLTPYRQVREFKPILKLNDSRETSTQIVPEFL